MKSIEAKIGRNKILYVYNFSKVFSNEKGRSLSIRQNHNEIYFFNDEIEELISFLYKISKQNTEE